jgi:serine/threonine protein kinase
MIVWNCTHCGKSLKVREELAGRKVKCPGCGQPATVPPAATLPTGPARAAAGLNPELWSFLAPAQQPDEIGRLGPYRVLQVLGAGGMGVVFQAEDPQLKRPVALKAMLPALAANDSARKRFLREAQAAAAIQHDHIVTIFQVGDDRGTPFLAMEFLRGESLDARLQREGKLPVPEVLRIGREIAEGLAAAHAQGLIHRDVKPANVWLEARALRAPSPRTGEETITQGGLGAADYRVKILDFGLARTAGADAQLTQVGAIVGTPAYMAPEQANGEPVDHRCDLFSLGCVLYRLCTGELPFKGPDPLTLLLAVFSANPRPPREVNPAVPAGLSDLVMQLLAKKPGDRPQSAGAVAAALEEMAGDRTVALAPMPRGLPGVAAPAPASTSKRLGLLLGAGGVLVALLVLFVLVKPSPQTGNGPPSLPSPAVAPFDAARAREHQEAWAKHRGVPLESTNSLGMQLVLIPPGEFLMGYSEQEIEDLLREIPEKLIADRVRASGPPHRVKLSRPYLLGKHEVTSGQFAEFVEATGYPTGAEKSGKGASVYAPRGKTLYALDPKINWRNPGFAHTKEHPVGALTWEDARDFCLWLSRKEGRVYRLPTEAEWEFACRAGATGLSPYGPSPTADQAVLKRGPVPKFESVRGGRKANAFGLVDMIGNVWEYCADFYAPYSPAEQTDPAGPLFGDEQKSRIRRGFSYDNDRFLGCAYRLKTGQTQAGGASGFRVVCELGPPAPSDPVPGRAGP